MALSTVLPKNRNQTLRGTYKKKDWIVVSIVSIFPKPMHISREQNQNQGVLTKRGAQGIDNDPYPGRCASGDDYLQKDIMNTHPFLGKHVQKLFYSFNQREVSLLRKQTGKRNGKSL